MTNHVRTYLFPSEAKIEAFFKTLETHYQLIIERESSGHLFWYDSFDRRLHAARLFLTRRGSLWRLHHFSEQTESLSYQGKTNGHFYWDFEPGPFRDLLAKALSIRALLKRAAVSRNIRHIAMKDELGKTVLRMKLFYRQLSEPKQADLHTVLEITSLKGYESIADDIDNQLQVLAQKGKKHVQIVTHQDRTYREVMKAAGYGDRVYTAKPKVRVAPDETAFNTLTSILTTQLKAAEVTKEGIVEDWDTEFLHDYRIAVRTARGALSQMKGVYDEAGAAFLKSHLRDIASITNTTRDIDVYLLAEDRYLALLPEHHKKDAAPFFNYLRRKRKKELTSLRHFFAESFEQEVQALHDRITTVEAGPRAEKPIRAEVLQTVRKRYKKIVGKGSNIEPSTPDEALHELRIDCKKLRYTLEIFKMVLPEKANSKLIKRLKRLQNLLGDFNDLSVQQRTLEQFVRNPATAKSLHDNTIFSMGILVGRLAAEQARVRVGFKKAFRAFANPESEQLIDALNEEQNLL